eukprot:TRINITY_DN2122_c0_g2_i1.p2 TRINITY_DN2122_c0_g2~~TRINITY_DN2122_c0_g2_i1.p2  ORF type:complete len:217 (+),score=56.58 TRINITY_DN2122_c0_g2_i1:59-652(+)
MVSFSCEKCGDVIKKPKIKVHQQRCWTHGFSCIDCNERFDTTTIDNHKSCVSESERYAGNWLKKQEDLKKKNKEKRQAAAAAGQPVKRRRSPVRELSSPVWTPDSKPATPVKKVSPIKKSPAKEEKKAKKPKKEKKEKNITIIATTGDLKIPFTVSRKKLESAKNSEDNLHPLIKSAIDKTISANIKQLSKAAVDSL